MTSPYRIERDRGIKDSAQQLAVLREKWPLAFPVKLSDVRPLAAGASREIATSMGWSLPYTLGVIGSWKLAPSYCRAVLHYDQRITLDGAPAEAVDAGAKEMATKRLEELAARGTPKIEQERGIKDSSRQLAVLREKWPLAFPVKLSDVRPLASSVIRDIAATMGWSLPYTLGVVSSWKMAPFYCQAVLQHDQRITLEGAPAGAVDAKAKERAAKRLAELAAHRAAKKVAKSAKPAVTKPAAAPQIAPLPETPKPTVTAAKPAPKKPATTAKPAVTKPKPVPKKAVTAKPTVTKPALAPPPIVPETPEQLRERVRASLLRRSA